MKSATALTLTAAIVLAGLAVSAVSAARAPTYVERVTIMDAFNVPGRSWPSRCVKILVSTVDPRYAMLTSSNRPPSACVKNHEVANGFVLFRRAAPDAVRWRNITEGRGSRPCTVPLAVQRDLLGSQRC